MYQTRLDANKAKMLCATGRVNVLPIRRSQRTTKRAGERTLCEKENVIEVERQDVLGEHRMPAGNQPPDQRQCQGNNMRFGVVSAAVCFLLSLDHTKLDPMVESE